MNKKFFILLCFVFAFSWVGAQTIVIDSVFYQNVWRNYRLFLPSSFSPSTGHPLVFNLHGFGSDAFEQEAYSGFDDVAETAHVVVCYPNGINNSWNVISVGSDDIGFIDTLISLLHDEYNINLNRVYSTGLSNGGFMSNLLGCALAHRIAAIAPVAGTNTFAVQSDCSPSRHVPVLYIHGTADPIVQYGGSTSYASASDLMELWSSANGCSILTDIVLLPDISTTDFCRAQRITWHDCDSNKQVIHYRIIDGGHTWPGASVTIGVTNQDFNASQIIWNFFSQFSLNTGIENVPPTQPIIISPNPFSSFLNVELSTTEKYMVTIYSADGRLILSSEYSGSHFLIPGKDLLPGMYFLRITIYNRSSTFRIIKMH